MGVTLKRGLLQEMKYTKGSGEQTDRVVIPTQVPNDCVKAIDVTDLSVSERQEMEKIVSLYNDYTDLQFKKIFSFEDFSEQVTNNRVEPKWRTFKITGISVS
jgi:hypothetical protein